MTAPLYQYPAKTVLSRVVAKQRILAHVRASNRLRERLRDEVGQINWHAKLAHNTLNLPGTFDVPELQVFVITLKGEDLHRDVLRAIDRAIPFPILFELHGVRGIRVTAAYKRPSQADVSKWVLHDHYASSDWLSADTPRQPLPTSIDLKQLYQQLLRNLLPAPARQGEAQPDQLERLRAMEFLKKDADKLEKRMRNEKQFNRKVEINAELRSIREKIAAYDT
ncbi:MULTISPECIES: DUF4391 domain-containing protein [unclassified Halomonas]|uniref:DUF4391 domain-containing protein n=1 Tax=unclassified Halomonas TaxID=2609666 RepID=UPI0020A1D9BE|nr:MULTISPECIES: DUF4391 domain-containing protein [unclassified Halomonas]MCP1314234.1 DUF4391 domain-containing protein [Halomonas sp. 707D7]MCP1325322.1 DUF4391 domain-containing protein [Halomonas sp. 707D4]